MKALCSVGVKGRYIVVSCCLFKTLYLKTLYHVGRFCNNSDILSSSYSSFCGFGVIAMIPVYFC
jgi:hypothetical protein